MIVNSNTGKFKGGTSRLDNKDGREGGERKNTGDALLSLMITQLEGVSAGGVARQCSKFRDWKTSNGIHQENDVSRKIFTISYSSS